MLGGMNRYWYPDQRESRHKGKAVTATAAWVLALAGLLSTAPGAHAQRVEKGSIKDPPATAKPGPEPASSLGSEFGSSAPVGREHAPTMASLVNAEPEGWELYFKGGPVFPLGDGFFERRVATGWTAQLGLRQPLYRPADQPWMVFAEYGGGYTANTGRGKRPVTTSGIVYFPNDDHIHPSNDFFDTQLIELQRAFVHGAMGMFYYPEFMNKPGERLFHVHARLGLRAGGMRTIFNQQIQLGLRRSLDAHVGPNRTHQGHTPETAQFFPDAKEPEMFISTFGSVGFGFTHFDARLFGRKFADVTFGAEIEFNHEWFDAGAYGHNDPGFGSYSPMLSLSFSF